MPELGPMTHVHVPPPQGAFERAYASGSRRRRRKLASLLAVGGLAVALATAGLVSYRPDANGSGDEQQVTAEPLASTEQTPQIPPRAVAVEGVDYLVPTGWKTGQYACSRVDHTVYVVVPTSIHPCPMIPASSTRNTVLITPMNWERAATFGAGKRTVWQGQPAFLSEVAGSDGGTEVTLTLPWLNVSVIARSPDPATARGLLDNIRVRTGSGLDLPKTPTSVTLQSLAGHDVDGVTRAVTLRRTEDIQALLDVLRSQSPVEPSAIACSNDAGPQMAVITVNGETVRTFLARFDGCDQLVGNTGHAFKTDLHLLQTLRRLIPKSGL